MDNCIIRTLSYFDVFDYPLTFSEIKKYLCCEHDYTDEELLDVISVVSTIQESNGFYYLLGRYEITTKREERGDASIHKLAKARVVTKALSIIPTIQYIGISGSLSMHNASSSDDIDLFIVTRKNTLWMTRMIVNLFLLSTRQKRVRNAKSVQDKICTNMFVEEDMLGFTGKRRTLYTAHEIVQLKTAFDRNHIHEKLYSKNKWIREFIPNVSFTKTTRKKPGFWEKAFGKLLTPIEKVCYFVQLFYMRRKRSIEFVTQDRAFFHPIDRQKLILDMFEIRYDRYIKIYEDNAWVDKEDARFYLEQKKIRILN